MAVEEVEIFVLILMANKNDRGFDSNTVTWGLDVSQTDWKLLTSGNVWEPNVEIDCPRFFSEHFSRVSGKQLDMLSTTNVQLILNFSVDFDLSESSSINNKKCFKNSPNGLCGKVSLNSSRDCPYYLSVQKTDYNALNKSIVDRCNPYCFSVLDNLMNPRYQCRTERMDGTIPNITQCRSHLGSKDQLLIWWIRF